MHGRKQIEKGNGGKKGVSRVFTHNLQRRNTDGKVAGQFGRMHVELQLKLRISETKDKYSPHKAFCLLLTFLYAHRYVHVHSIDRETSRFTTSPYLLIIRFELIRTHLLLPTYFNHLNSSNEVFILIVLGG